MSHPNPSHDSTNERTEDSSFAPSRRNPIFKSKRRHALKQIDRKWASRKIKGPALQRALDNLKK